MKYTHRYQDSFVERKALEYWHNLVRNLQDKIDEREFFDFFIREDTSRQTIKLVRKRPPEFGRSLVDFTRE